MSPAAARAGAEGRPRLAPLPADDLSPYARTVFDGVGPGGAANLVATMARHPRLFERFVPVTVALQDGELADRHRELAILRTAAWRRCRYVWEQHARLAAARAGLTTAEIEAIGAGADGTAFGRTDRAVIGAVDELLRESTVAAQTWAGLAGDLDPAQLVELCLLVGHYSGLCFLANAAAVEPDPGGAPGPAMPPVER